ncbi:MAG: putative oxidoreductase [Flavobacteriales bacterium]|jgi:putative oxidoreductase
MNVVVKLSNGVIDILDKFKSIDFIAFLALRVFLAPIFIMAGMNKLSGFEGVVDWFGNDDWGLGLPMPAVLASLAIFSEIVGGFALLFGLATRLFSIPLIFVMLVAIFSVHVDKGWHVLPETEIQMPWEWRTDLIEDGNVRKEAARSLLKNHGNYEWLTEAGSITVLKNGIEFAATYIIMLLALFFNGPGRFVSVDYWLKRKFRAE